MKNKVSDALDLGVDFLEELGVVETAELGVVETTKVPPVFCKKPPDSEDYTAFKDPIGDLALFDFKERKKDKRQSICLPLCVDTEFESTPEKLKTGTVLDNPENPVPIIAQRPRERLTVQVKSKFYDEVVIFLDPKFAETLPEGHTLKKLPLFTSDFVAIDFLRHLGYKVSVEEFDKNNKAQAAEYKSLPTCLVALSGHHFVSDYMLIVNGKFREYFKALSRIENPKNERSLRKPRFWSRKILGAKTVTLDKHREAIKIENQVLLPFIIEFDCGLTNLRYKLAVSVIDTYGLNGYSSYANLAKATGVNLEKKDSLTSEDKASMRRTLTERPEQVIDYARDDVRHFEILWGNLVLVKFLCDELALKRPPKRPSLTIGSTTNKVLRAAIETLLDINSAKEYREFIDLFARPLSAKYLQQFTNRSSCLLAKVEGGRCRSNRPTDTRILAPICDIDIGGCYASSMLVQEYPIGVPLVGDYLIEPGKRKTLESLGEFLRKYRHELIPGLWMVRVSTIEPLKYPQDLISSWFVSSKGGDILQMSKYLESKSKAIEIGDTDEQTLFNLDEGRNKILLHEIKNGLINHDILEWIDHVASPRQRNELLEKVYVDSFAIYPKSDRIAIDPKERAKIEKITDPEEFAELYKTLLEKYTKHRESVNICKNGENSDWTISKSEYHGWFSVNLGQLLIDKLLKNRKFWQIVEGKKSPQEQIFKLLANTMYGVMTSQYFELSNVVVGNNITARARVTAWLLEKGVHGFQTITDGCAFELNRVLYPVDEKRRVTGENVVGIYRFNDRDLKRVQHLRLAPLGGCDRIELNWTGKSEAFLTLHKEGKVEVLSPEDSRKWVNETTMKHLQRLFPKISVLHKKTKQMLVSVVDGKPHVEYADRVGCFSFEMKDFYDAAVFHGSANYLFKSPKEQVIKMRSYETKREHFSVESSSSGLLITDRYGVNNNPAKDFLHQLMNSPDLMLDRQVPFIKESILKLGDYKHNFKKYDRYGLTPGDTHRVSGLLREFSLSQFTFKTLDQYLAWEKAVEKRKKKYGHSVEGFFIVDGKLDYQRMVVTIDNLINDGVMEPFAELDKHRNTYRSETLEHPHHKTLVRLKQWLDCDSEVGDEDVNDVNDVVDVVDVDGLTDETVVAIDEMYARLEGFDDCE